MRLTLRFYAETHRLFNDLATEIAAIVSRSADSDGNLSAGQMVGRIANIELAWRKTLTLWVKTFEKGREQAASIPFGWLVVQHNHYMGLAASLNEAMSRDSLTTIIRLWERRRENALDVAARRLESDGFQLSDRIHRLENGGLQRIKNTIAAGMAEGTSAVKLAKDLEQYLGAGQNCPRWAFSRLYGQTATERQSNRDGLFTGNECAAQGVAYNALRLARTEFQYAHHAVTDQIYSASPWVKGKRVNLSPTHPKSDICDTYAAGGPYPADEQILPLHPNCLCYYTAEVMKDDEFINSVRGWLRSENDFLDDYRGWLGVDQIFEPLPFDMPLAALMELWLDISAGGHAAALGF